jgi:outer membrane immunogenic protein
MNLVKPMLLASLLVTSSAVTAQASKFQGGFGQFGIGYESVSPTSPTGSLTVNRLTLNANPSFSSSNSFAGTLAVGWYQDVAKGFLLGVGVEYSPFEGEKSSQTVRSSSLAPNQNNITNSYKWQKKNSYNIFISPAMTVGTDGLAYAKIGYTGAQAKQYDTLTYNFTGYSLGLGYKQVFSGGWYGFAEANYSSYGNQTKSATNPISPGRTLTASGTNSLTSYNVLVGVGYKF